MYIFLIASTAEHQSLPGGRGVIWELPHSSVTMQASLLSNEETAVARQTVNTTSGNSKARRYPVVQLRVYKRTALPKQLVVR